MNVIENLLRSLLVVSTMLSSCAYAEIKKDDFVIKAGLLKKINNEKYVVYKETTYIPYITKKANPNFRFGYTLHTKSDIPFYHHIVLDTPMLETVSGDFIGANRKGKSRITATTKKVLNKNYGYYFTLLEESDPLGIYRINIFINDELLNTIEFNVLAPVDE